MLGVHPTSRSLRAHQSRRDHRALFRPETGSRSFAGSWDPRLGPLLSNDRGHLPEARMLPRERKFHDKSFSTSATCHGGAPRTDTTCLRSAPHPDVPMFRCRASSHSYTREGRQFHRSMERLPRRQLDLDPGRGQGGCRPRSRLAQAWGNEKNRFPWIARCQTQDPKERSPNVRESPEVPQLTVWPRGPWAICSPVQATNAAQRKSRGRKNND